MCLAVSGLIRMPCGCGLHVSPGALLDFKLLAQPARDNHYIRVGDGASSVYFAWSAVDQIFLFNSLGQAAVIMRCPAGSSRCQFFIVSNPYHASNLQTMPLIKARFCLKKRAVLQKNVGPTEIILHFFSRVSDFSGFFPLQAIVFQPPAATRPWWKRERSSARTRNASSAFGKPDAAADCPSSPPVKDFES